MTEKENYINRVSLDELKNIAQRWMRGNEIRKSDDPLLVELAQKVGVVLEEGRQYALVAHGSRGGFYQPIIDEIGFVATESTHQEWTLVVAGTIPFIIHINQIQGILKEDRPERWNVWLAPVNSEVLEGELDITSPWFDYKDPEVIGWSEEKMKVYSIEKYGRSDHKYIVAVRHLRIVPVKFQIGRY